MTCACVIEVEKPKADTIMKRQAPTHTNMCVRMPRTKKARNGPLTPSARRSSGTIISIPVRPLRCYDFCGVGVLTPGALVIWNSSSSHYKVALQTLEESACGECRCERPADRVLGAECAGASVLGEASPSSPCCAVAI